MALPDLTPEQRAAHLAKAAAARHARAELLARVKDGTTTVAEVLASDDETCRRLNQQLDFAVSRENIARVLERLYLPAPDGEGIVPQFEGYFGLKHVDLTPYKQASVVGTIYNDYNIEQISAMQVHKQADTLALMLLMDDLFPADVKKKNYYFYEARTLHDSSLSKSTHCVLAADLHEDETAYSFFKGCGEIDLGPKMTTSDMGVHTASMGGIWQCAVYGFGGARVVGGQLRVAPRLPACWQTLAFPLCWRGQPLLVEAERSAVRVSNNGTEAVEIELCGRRTRIAPGETVSAVC